MSGENAMRPPIGRLLAAAMLAGMATGGTVRAMEVALTVREPAGVARVQDPCRSGIPLAPGALTDAAKLRLLDAGGREVPAQFRVINRRPAGDVEWVCVSFLADVPANGSAVYRLTDGGPAKAPDNPLAVKQSDSAIEVITGPLKLLLPKTALAGLGQVWLDRNADGRFADDELASGGGALVVKGVDGRTYSSVSDLAAPPAVSVEESGPLHAVIRVDGEMKVQSADGKEHTYPTYDGSARTVNPEGVRQTNKDGKLGFTVRLHVWKGQTAVRAFVTMRNLAGWSLDWTERKIQFGSYYADSCQKPGNWLVDAVTFDLDLQTAGPLAYRIGGGVEGSEVHTGRLGAARDAVVLYQDSSAGWRWQAATGHVFDERLTRNIAFMKDKAREKAREEARDPELAASNALPFHEFVSYEFEELMKKRDGNSFMGYRLFTNAPALQPGSGSSFADLGPAAAEGQRAPGWIEADDGRTAVVAGCRWFWQTFPKSLELRAPGRLSVGLWSQYFPRGHLFEGTIHKTHEVLFDFRSCGPAVRGADRFAAFAHRLIATPDPRHNLASRVYGDFMLPTPGAWTNFEASALAAVEPWLDRAKNPGWASGIEIEREKYDNYDVWKFGDSVKGGWHYFGQYLELDVPYCLMVHYARTGDRRFFDAAEEAVRSLLDIPAHGGGYGHQNGESSHYYVYGPLLYANADGAPFLRDAIRHAHRTTPIRAWHLRSFAIVMWSNWAMYQGFEEDRPLHRAAMDAALDWWTKNQKPDGSMVGMSRTSQAFFLGMGGDALGRYAESFPEDKQRREALVKAMREWMTHLLSLQEEQRRPLLDKTCANAFAYASRFSGDPAFLRFAEESLVRDDRFPTHYRTGISSAKNWSETMGAHRLVQVFLHDIGKQKQPDRYGE